MNNNLTVILVLAICVITAVYVTYSIPTDEKYSIIISNLQAINKFLEEERDTLKVLLHQRNLEYEWLSEITNELLDMNNDEIKEFKKEINENRSNRT